MANLPVKIIDSFPDPYAAKYDERLGTASMINPSLYSIAGQEISTIPGTGLPFLSNARLMERNFIILKKMPFAYRIIISLSSMKDPNTAVPSGQKRPPDRLP